jgi:hypothetical protein
VLLIVDSPRLSRLGLVDPPIAVDAIRDSPFEQVYLPSAQMMHLFPAINCRRTLFCSLSSQVMRCHRTFPAGRAPSGGIPSCNAMLRRGGSHVQGLHRKGSTKAQSIYTMYFAGSGPRTQYRKCQINSCPTIKDASCSTRLLLPLPCSALFYILQPDDPVSFRSQDEGIPMYI